MKATKTLLFMLWSPMSFIAYTFACGILFSASITMSDDPFVYGVLPDAAEAVNEVFADLPGSLWKLVTAFSLIVEEVVGDFHYGVFMIVIPLALTFSYREARGSRNGITTERKVWMQWYERQQLVKAQQGVYETPPLSEHIPGGSYFISARKTVLFMFRHPPLLIGHFVCWFILFALPMLFVGTTDFVRSLPEIVIYAVIFTLILSYREARSNLKGVAIERGIWTKWYARQIKAIAQEGAFEEPPSPENMKAYAYFGEIPETLFFMVCNLKPFIIHLTCWIAGYALLFFTTLPPRKVPDDIFVNELIGMFGEMLPWIALIVFVISYREARGNLKGIANRKQAWMRWYQAQQETIKQGDTFEEPPPSENAQADSYFKKTQKTLQFMARHPLSLIVHLACWFLAFIFRYGDFLASMPILFVIIPALISSYQEARGTVKGAAKEGAEWMKWYQRQTGAKAQAYSLAEVPPALNAR